MSRLMPCTVSGCPELARGGWCPKHRREHERGRGSATERGYGGRAWRFTRRYVIGRDPFCNEAGCSDPSTDAAHIVPRTEGGSDDPSNLRGLCHRHHSSESARRGERWG